MSGKWFATYVVAASIAFAFGACGGEDPVEDCVECDFGGAAVWCYLGGSRQGICGVTIDIAAANCIEAGGIWAPAEICPFDPGTETGGNNEPWVPGRDVTFDERAGEYVLDRAAFDEIQRNPALLMADTSVLEPIEGGYYMLTASGPLSDALGWELGDVLLEANGHDLRDLEAVTNAYADLAASSKFELRIERDEGAVVLYYRVE